VLESFFDKIEKDKKHLSEFSHFKKLFKTTIIDFIKQHRRYAQVQYKYSKKYLGMLDCYFLNVLEDFHLNGEGRGEAKITTRQEPRAT
jgi:hypothetical protein